MVSNNQTGRTSRMDRIDQAFRFAQRQHFLPPQAMPAKDIDAPLAIGYGQTNSQPTTVRRMLEWLDPAPGHKVLDLGSGSGWTSALLAYLVGEAGSVIAVEIIPALVAFGRENCRTLGITNATFHQAGPVYGYPEQALYDRILVSASTDELPLELIAQLATPGRLVIPVRHSIVVIDKDADGSLRQHDHPGYVFVPLLRPARR